MRLRKHAVELRDELGGLDMRGARATTAFRRQDASILENDGVAAVSSRQPGRGADRERRSLERSGDGPHELLHPSAEADERRGNRPGPGVCVASAASRLPCSSSSARRFGKVDSSESCSPSPP